MKLDRPILIPDTNTKSLSIGLVTWNGSSNFGTNLQAYALFTQIQKLGYTCFMVSPFPQHKRTLLKRSLFAYGTFKHALKARKAPKTGLTPNEQHDPIKEQRIADFVEKHFTTSKPVRNLKEWNAFAAQMDGFVTGSDQIWNPNFFDSFYFLDLVNDKTPKIAYASSIGVNQLPASKISTYTTLLSRFNALSLREQKGVDQVVKLTGKTVERVLDPTLLVETEVWNTLAGINQTTEKPYMLCYFVGNNSDVPKQVLDSANKLGIQRIILLPMHVLETWNTVFSANANANAQTTPPELLVDSQAGPVEFVRYIRDAAVICTDSFHATTLSISLKKDFITFVRFRKDDPQSQNSRVFELLEEFGLTHRLYNETDQSLHNHIDYEHVNTLLKVRRKQSLQYLKKALPKPQKQICPQHLCTGCTACVNVCPVSCIRMQEDSLGALHPEVDMSTCIECNKCVDVCPTNYQPNFNQPKHVYAAWSENTAERKLSASGGIAHSIGSQVIEKGGIVYGTRFDEALNPIVDRASNAIQIQAFKGSKYVHSDVGSTYKQVQEDLQAGREVLYTGLPCQIAGLQNFLGKAYTNLLTIDLICHGVSPATYLHQEIAHIKHKHHLEVVTDCRFRGNDGQNFKFSLWNESKCVHTQPAYTNYYFSGYLYAVTLRENCYHCPYASSQRISDITLGDFIGLGTKVPFPHQTENVSVAIVNTQKGMTQWNTLIETNQHIRSVERPYAEAIEFGPSLRAPFSHHPKTPKFRAKYLKNGWVKSIRSVLCEEVFVRKSFFNLILHKYTLRLPRLYGNKLLNHLTPKKG